MNPRASSNNGSRTPGAWLIALGGTVSAILTLVCCSSFSSGDSPGSAADASADTPVDAVDSDASVRRAAFSIACAESTCIVTDGGEQACCYSGTRTRTFECVEKTAPCPDSAGNRYACDDTDDCVALGKANTICCGTLTTVFSSSYHLDRSRCTAPSSCAGPLDLVLCDPAIENQCGASRCSVVDVYPIDDGGSQPVLPSVDACKR